MVEAMVLEAIKCEFESHLRYNLDVWIGLCEHTFTSIEAYLAQLVEASVSNAD
jgi:hypothetical protein